jgi:transposase InsO family protein
MDGNLKGIGKIYLQAAAGCHSRFAFGRLYASKVPAAAVHVLNEKALPLSGEHECPAVSILTGNGGEYCGRMDGHPFELFLQPECVEHKTAKAGRPQSSGIVERLHRTLLDGHFRIQGRIKFYESLDEMQAGLDSYLRIYNYERAHQGRNMNGRTPHQAFAEGIPNQLPKEETAA